MAETLEAYYGLPPEVLFCKRCVHSNQMPSSYPEFRHTVDRICPTLPFNEESVCDACRYHDIKVEIDWNAREEELLQVLDQHRRSDGHYDCIVPGSGGKDSAFAAHVLKYKYGMNPLTITWPPLIYTDYGWDNFKNWLDVGGFDNITFRPNGRVHRLLTKLAIQNLLHPFQPFIIGQKNLPPKIAIKYGIPLVFYGEAGAEYNNPISETETSLKDPSFHGRVDLSGIYFSGVSMPELNQKYDISLNDLSIYLPATHQELAEAKVEFRNLGYFIKWVPQEAYYYAVEHTGFRARPFRTEGTYSKYNSIDDKIDDLQFYTTFIKFGLGRATYEAAQEIRNQHLTREEGVALVRQFDGEFPQRYFNDVMDYIGMNPEEFLELCDKFRSPHIWEINNGEWNLRHQLS